MITEQRESERVEPSSAAIVSLIETPGLGTARLAVATQQRIEGWLFHPLVDFMCLSGGSLIALVVLAFFVQSEALGAGSGIAWLAVATMINYPHFAHSYQIFYSGFRGKAFGKTFDPRLRRRYVFAGVIVPPLLAGFLAVSVLARDPLVLGYAGNAMLFLVGWHYAKQGYGMAMLDAVLKRRFFSATEKQVLLANAYACWFFSWLLANDQVSMRDLWGLAYYAFEVPGWLMAIAVAAAGATSIVFFGMLIRKGRAESWQLPWNGLLAYATTLYAWMVFAQLNPAYLLIVPAFHSLQYQVVVWRYQLNRSRAQPGADLRPADVRLARLLPSIASVRFTLFLIFAVMLGFLGFLGLPEWLDRTINYDYAIFGPTLFYFCFWTFINVHHYFLDNVMWRKENPETRRYLFGARS